MNAQPQLTASVVSHGQMRLVNLLITDLVRNANPQLRRLVVTLNVPEAEPIRAESAPFEVRVLRNDHARGFGANHNRAFQNCETAWFAVLNPDLRFPTDALGTLLAARTTIDGLLAPLILDTDGVPTDSARRLPTPWQVLARRLRLQRSGPDPDFDWLAGMCLLVNSEAFRSLGGFDERFFMYCEDTDLCLRLQRAGWRLRQLTRARVIHDARRQSHRSLRYLGWHVASLLRLWASRIFWSYLTQRRRLRSMRQVDPG
jgi:N-acetylglucosaminyl-diphospho-decaprenol L-rhamnosyltransferase